MFSKLALRNVRRSFRDYGVYLLTLTFGVCLFYAFNSLEGQSVMTYLANNGHTMVKVILNMMDIFSVFVVVVLACLILYANQFLMRRRKRELGTYLLLGLSQGQVSRMLFLETIIIGVVSLVLGLGLGVLASYGLSALSVSMFSMNADLLRLVFSPKAALKTGLYFGIIFLLVMFFSGLQVSRAKLIDLIQGERKNEELKERPLRVAVIQFIVGVILLLVAYAMLLMIGMVIVVILPLCIPMLAMGTIGTLLIFKSLSGFIMRLVQSKPKLYFKGLNLFTLRQWISKVHSTYLSQTVICLLLLLAIGITASSIGMNSSIQNQSDEQTPFDISIQNLSGDTTPVDFDALLIQGGFDRTLLGQEHLAMLYYNAEEITGDPNDGAVISLSDFNRLMVMQGKKGMTLASGEVVTLDEELEGVVTGNLRIHCIVVEDSVANQLEPRRQIWSANYVGDPEGTELALKEAMTPFQELNLSLRIESKLEIYQSIMGSKVLALFLGLYLGFTFLLAAAAVLALQQMSQAADNSGRYRILRRLGAQEKQVSRSATQQVALAFLLPLGLALVHSAVGMRAANEVIFYYGKVDSTMSTVVTALVILVIYGGYFLATALACRRMALTENR